MIHQVEGILLIWIYWQDVSDSYKAKSKSFVIVDDFCWIEASVNGNLCINNCKNSFFNRKLILILNKHLSFLTCKPNLLDESLEDHKLIEWLRSKFHFPEELGHWLWKF